MYNVIKFCRNEGEANVTDGQGPEFAPGKKVRPALGPCVDMGADHRARLPAVSGVGGWNVGRWIAGRPVHHQDSG